MKGCDGCLGIQDTLKALADPIRREILNLLKNGRLSAGEICEHFSVTGASISRHLAILKEADLIRDKREGKFIYYERNTSVLEDVMLWITDLKRASDYEGNDKKYSGTLICSVLVMLAGVLVGFTCTQSIYTHASCHSITQLDSRHFFQIGALPGQRRRGDMKLLRRPCNILPPRDHKEVIQCSKFHIDPFCPVFLR